MCNSTSLPFNIESKYNQVILHYSSHDSGSVSSFQLSYTTIVGCGGFLTYSSGEFELPHVDEEYADHKTCGYLIQTLPHLRIKVTFSMMSNEGSSREYCLYDNLKVKNYIAFISIT